ncbi:MAG TPA: CBS domain-containing protein [Gammaproteobacteria bacterium]|nr:CBS domain-containing protein [Gammaproteobacteria bacterium]
MVTNIVEKFGMSTLEKRELRTPISEIMDTDCETVSPDMGLLAAGEFFTAKKASCLPVVEEGKLRGIVTSVDFVKLALYLLKT